jgi:hypothetical protein
VEGRTQFTFYESFYSALRRIKKKQDRADAYDLICEYALYQKEPNMENLPDSVSIAFELLRPVLDSARKKASNGKQGGSKPKANQKQTESKQKQPLSKKEGEKEKEEEKEKETEKEKEQASVLCGRAFTSFWEAYPWKMNREEAWNAWKELNPDFDTVIKIMTSLEAWKKSERWLTEQGRYVPSAAKFLREKDGYWGNPPQPVVAQKPQQGYVHGADRLLAMIERGDFDD